MRVTAREIPELSQGDPMGVVAWAFKLKYFLKRLIDWIESIDGGIVPPPGDERDWIHDANRATLAWDDYTISDAWRESDITLFCANPTDGDTKSITLPTPGPGRWLTLTLFYQMSGAWTAGAKWEVLDNEARAVTNYFMSSVSVVPNGKWQGGSFWCYLENDGSTYRWTYTAVRGWDEDVNSDIPS